jgi:hypothetical protein
MSTNFFYDKLEYELTDSSNITASHPEYHVLERIGVDKVYFAGRFPAILFKEVDAFNEQELREIAAIQRKVWNYRKVMFLFAVSDTEIRIYNCYEKPVYLNPSTLITTELSVFEVYRAHRNEKTRMAVVTTLFSRISVDCGLIWTNEHHIREKVNVNRRIDHYLLTSLLKAAEMLSLDIDNPEIIHGLLIRSILILYLEDKGAAKEAGIYEQINGNAHSYLDILDNAEDTYKLFDKLREHFGDIFPVTEEERNHINVHHLMKVKECFTDGYLQAIHASKNDWRVFDFSFIRIELLSEVYENFLGELEHRTGQFYTPYPLVELILNDKLPVANETNYDVKTLDIACSSGAFLVESYKRLIQRCKNANPGKSPSFRTLQAILLNNIYGVDTDPVAIKIAAFNLYMVLIDHLDPKTLWTNKKYQTPRLTNINDLSIRGRQGKNLLCRDTIGEVNAEHFLKVDLLIGNPPFGTDNISPAIKKYLDERKYAQETVLAFLDKAVRFIKDDGQIAMIFNTKILTNTNKNYRNFRRWLFNKNYVEKVYNLSIFKKARKDFGGQLFHSSTVPVSIVYYQKSSPAHISDSIEYCAPKTYVKSNVIDALIIDDTDIKFLSRNECQQANTKIWKIAMWGNFHDFSLLSWLNSVSETDMKSYFKKNKWIHASGLNGDSKHRDLAPSKIVETKAVSKYYTPDSAAVANDKYYRKIDENLFVPPFIVLEKGQKGKQIAASYIDYPAYFKSGVFIMNNNDDSSIEAKKILVAFLNSDLVSYYLFLSSSSWGIERGQIFFNEYLELPVFTYDKQDSAAIAGLFDELVAELKQDIPDPDVIIQKEKAINRKLEDVIGLMENEQILIQDTLNFSLDLFENGENSIGFKQTSEEENNVYADMICTEINLMLQHSMIKACATIYEVQQHDPLNLVVLSFQTRRRKAISKSVSELNNVLKMLNDCSSWQNGQGLYGKKQYRYYDDNAIYLIKPNQKRFWTRSQAMDDAMSLSSEIESHHSTISAKKEG